MLRAMEILNQDDIDIMFLDIQMPELTGIEFLKNNWTFTSSLSGYSGYKEERDKPMAFNFDVKKKFKNKSVQVQYIHGIRDWEYDTVKIAFIWHFKGID